ncbi:hypothetical protein [Bowmanella dokdonensis]|uniref:Uncharacterized protein n=1 Tax=Bowmanella dokdonensis TaxID=751969 RepID=A0A939DN18_9ALTE|nr:hypothetical protein [Bowmanella dokdonensis]MBN7825605.1 hypothetical protein [Bowmanella dokdonensis]
MKLILLTSLFFIFICPSLVTAEELFSVSSKNKGISEFDYIVTEVKREKGYSVLSIPKFQERSAAASRWMMCAYNELAMLRNANMWAAIYTDDSGDKVTVVFPDSNSISDPAFDNVDLLDTQPRIMPTEALKAFCGF